MLPEGGDGALTTPPEGQPDLASLALGLEDLPAGATVVSDGYVDDPDAEASYAREFGVGSVRIGGSAMLGLVTELSILESERAAGTAFRTLGPSFANKRGRKDFAESFAASAGFEVKDLRIERVPAPSGLVAVRATFKTPGRALAAVFVFAHSGRALASIYATGARTLDPVAIIRLGEKIRSRLDAASL